MSHAKATERKIGERTETAWNIIKVCNSSICVFLSVITYGYYESLRDAEDIEKSIFIDINLKIKVIFWEQFLNVKFNNYKN